jgi:tetratricopeptide (TPR) repeat protein
MGMGGFVGTTLRLMDRAEGSEHVVELTLDGAGARRTAEARVTFEMSAQERENLRWYLEDYLQYPVDPVPEIARDIESRLAERGAELFRQVFEANRDTMRVWDAAGPLAECRVEVATGVEEAAKIPWELLRDPATDGVVAIRAGAFVRALAETTGEVAVPPTTDRLRVLLVICRPGGRMDVPFRSVASHLLRLSREARQALQLDVLRPPTYGQLTRVLQTAKKAGAPYHVVHFDGHGAWLADDAVTAGRVGRLDQQQFSVLSPVRPGTHGYLVFEDPSVQENQQLVDGPSLGQLLVDGGVPVLVLNACRSAHAGLATKPEENAAGLDAHGRVRAYGSLAQEVMDAGVTGVVAMAYNVYVVTAAQFIGQVYAALLDGQPLGAAVTEARRQLAADPQRQVGAQPLPLQDWLVPVVYEATPIALRPARSGEQELSIDLSQAEAGQERASLEPGLPGGPDAGFFGRDETLLALDRAFDDAQVVLLHAWAGAGKTSTTLEFARWYALTGGVQGTLFTSFERHLPLARLLDQIGARFGPALEGAGVLWATLDAADRRDVALQVLAQVPVLWVWDNVEPVAGFPAGTPSAWSSAEQAELLAFLRDVASRTRCKVLLTSRRDEQAWLGDVPARVSLPPMPMLERLELAQAVARRQTGSLRAFLAVEDWRPLLEFTQGNPLTVTILARQAIRARYTTKQQIEAFVAALRVGAATITADPAQGRGASLAASLDYGFTQAFTDDKERAILALLALFQGFADIDALRLMGSASNDGETVAALAELDREATIALLDRAAEVGLLTAYGGGYYAVHPAIPWYLQQVFKHHYGPPDSLPAQHATRAWTRAINSLGNWYYAQHGAGRGGIIRVLAAEEANLLQARRLALTGGWSGLVIGSMQGLVCLYRYMGRAVEWRLLVADLIPLFTDPATGGPRPALEEEWSILTGYRVEIAQDTRDLDTAQQLQNALIAWEREQAAEALTALPRGLDDRQRHTVYNLAGSLGTLGQILQEKDDPGCVQPYEEAIWLYQQIGARGEEGIGAFNLGNAYKNIPALRDLDQAQRWYERDLELMDQRDTLGRAKTIGQLGNVAYERFLDARRAGADQETLLGHIRTAIGTFLQVLDMIPDDAVDELAVTHSQLGAIYGDAGDIDRALSHYQRAIQHRERQDNDFGAGTARYNAAIDLANFGRSRDALRYAQAALRDFEGVGPGAAAHAADARRLIARIERLLQD